MKNSNGGGALKFGILVPTGIGDGLVLLKATFAIKHIWGGANSIFLVQKIQNLCSKISIF